MNEDQIIAECSGIFRAMLQNQSPESLLDRAVVCFVFFFRIDSESTTPKDLTQHETHCIREINKRLGFD